jgi:hypothetical protein
MITDQQFYRRRAAEEASRAARAITPAAQDHHRALAAEFAKRAEKCAKSATTAHHLDS